MGVTPEQKKRKQTNTRRILSRGAFGLLVMPGGCIPGTALSQTQGLLRGPKMIGIEIRPLSYLPKSLIRIFFH